MTDLDTDLDEPGDYGAIVDHLVSLAAPLLSKGRSKCRNWDFMDACKKYLAKQVSAKRISPKAVPEIMDTVRDAINTRAVEVGGVADMLVSEWLDAHPEDPEPRGVEKPKRGQRPGREHLG